MKTKSATIGPTTVTNSDLVKIPPPKDKLVAAVYGFRDQTGQYKNSLNGTSWSTAVTQGATSILLKALEESGWFTVIEREGLSNLLNERKIIRSSRENYSQVTGQQEDPLPPLLFAGILLEGGIISYDSNVLTGGAGLKYFGAGASGQYRQDRVTVYLRATSTQTGKILKTVYTSKTILSQVVDVGLFRFVEVKRLLEAETGYSYNEPPQIAVTEAIEKAVQSLIIEGAIEGLWEFAHLEDSNSTQVKNYLAEKELSKEYDYFGELQVDPRSFSLGIAGGNQEYQGDFSGNKRTYMGEFFIRAPLNEQLSAEFHVGGGELANKKYFSSKYFFGGIGALYYILPFYEISPFISASADLAFFSSEDRYGNEIELSNDWIPNLYIGAGVEYKIAQIIGLSFEFGYNQLLSDGIDGQVIGDLNDAFWTGSIGFSVYPRF